MIAVLSGIPDFSIGGVTFQCWTVEHGRFEWRSTCGTLTTQSICGRCFASVDGRRLPHEFTSLRAAMLAATSRKTSRAA